MAAWGCSYAANRRHDETTEKSGIKRSNAMSNDMTIHQLNADVVEGCRFRLAAIADVTAALEREAASGSETVSLLRHIKAALYLEFTAYLNDQTGIDTLAEDWQVD